LNYLAHAYLSFDDAEILTGNLISDFVKGKKKFQYPENIQKGITLHRAIDAFTDGHAAVKRGKEVFRSKYRLYSAAFVDVVFDHFLAIDAKQFPGNSLGIFSQRVYGTLDRYADYFPPRFAQMFPYMKRQNWLLGYRSKFGIHASFGGLVRRAKYLDESNTAALLFDQHYEILHACYEVFFPEVKSFAHALYRQMIEL
jgi:acyl carrier protein phosphodiesterase